MPRIEARPLKSGDDFTVWGASYSLRNRFEAPSVRGRKIPLIGFIVATNLDTAPRCAVHARGIADPPNCKAPLPAFWVGDTPDAPLERSIKVVGWAANYAQLHDAIREYAQHPDAKVEDDFWGITIPNPIPAKGAKVRIVGTHSNEFTKATTGIEADPVMGILDPERVEVLSPAPKKATLPGMRP